ncbi:Protocadherin gamma-C5 [Nibea albiflora]|uniref:Protocadherin gamma-C5 n=1 Tax=Nibea albiflora TaxID=240163 RepID=A0ACB7EPH6_NIBAL|nr:Protocadherin gamma-C5 [Nibea albiflora]
MGSTVGNLAKDLGLGLSDIFDRKLRVASEAGKQYFSVDAGKGELVVNDRIDREALCGQSTSCVLPLQVVIENPLQLHRIEVEIRDVNDNAPSFLKSDHIIEIAESTVVGVRFPLESAEDPDVGSNGLKTYTLSKDDCFTLKVKELENGRKIPELVLNKSLDREKKAIHNLFLSAMDGGNPAKSGTAKITVNVLDINDNVPLFENAFYKVAVQENSANGSFVITTKATDIDEGPNGEIEYSLGIHTPPSVLALFHIDAVTGDISLKNQLDYETQASYRIDISAKDKGLPKMEGHCSVQVDVLDVNDNAPEIVLTSKPISVPEDSRSGTVVALLSVRDLDSGDNGKVTLQLQRSPFTLKPSFSNNYALVTSGSLDRESFSEYNIEITATDSGSPPLSSKKIIPVSITDVNDNPPLFTQPSYNVYLKENGVAGSILYSVSASDLDFGENAKISYSILDSKVQDVSVSSYVYINSDNGSIYSMHSFDYEKLKVFQIQVQAKDQGSPSLSSNATVHVFILDQNDNAPAVIYPSSAAPGSLSHQRMPRSAKAGHLVTKVTAVDADSGHNAWISYKLAEATDASLFTVNLYTGEVRTKRAVTEQDDSSQRLLIEVKDDGEPVQSATATVSILLEDGLHEPVLDLRHKAAEPSKKNGRITLYLILSLASVSVLSLVTFLVLAVKCMRNSRSSGSCCTRRTDYDDYKNPNRNLQIQLNTDGPIKYVEVLGGDMLSQSQSFRSCMSPMSEYSDFTLIKPSSTTDFKEVISVLDASLPDSTWTFESQQIDVLDVNDNTPEIVLTSEPQPVREDAPSGTVVALLNARDTDSGNNSKVTLQLPKGSPFTLKPSFSNNYALVTSGPLDRESFSEYNIEITATDSGSPPLSSKKIIPVSITDVNDNTPLFTQPSYNVYLKENGVAGSILYSVSASDLDFGENAKISYAILDSKVQDVSVSSYVYINSDNGSIYSMHSFDYEKLKVFQIQVQAKDQGSPSLSSNATVHVFTLDQNDNAPAVIYPSSAAPGSLSHQRMPRSAKAGHLVTKVTAVDADSGHNAWISYKLAEATDASLFTVNLYTGEVRTKRAVTEQDDSSQRLLIEVKDDGEPVQSATATVSILLEDGLHEPVLDLRHKAAEPSKKNGRITLYLILSLASVSVLSLVTFLVLAVKCMRNSRSSGSCCTRRTDYDDYKNPNRNLQIQLNTDGPIKYVEVLGGDMLSQSQSFRSCMSPMSEYSDFTLIKPSSTTDFKEMISVLDASLPDSTWTFESQQPSYNVYLKENGVAGSILYSVSASDLDFGENAKISYSILDSKVQDVSVSSYVYINSDNGSIYSMHSFDYEKLKVFQIQVQVKDQGSPSLSSNATVHVFILDQNDNAPAVIYPSSAAPGSLSHQRMPRSAKAGHLVTKVTAVDADSGHNAWISYKLAEATDASLFTVNLYTGEVRTKRAVTEQDDSSQRLLIEVKDDGEPVQSATATVSILLEDGLHEPVLDLRHKAAEPSKKNGRITLYLILSLASVSVLSLVTFLVLAVKCMRNSRSSGSCCTRRTDYDDYKNPNRNLQIQLNTDGPIKYVEVLGGDMLSQSQSFRSCMSPMSEYSDFTLIKPSSTTDFKEVISVLDASLPDSTWTFESQQVSRKD